MRDHGMQGWPADDETLGKRLEQMGLPEDVQQALRDTARPALMLATRPVDEETISPGATKIGGRPDLPPGFAWPDRPAYPDGEEAAKQVLERAEGFLIAAGVAPPWLPAAKAQRLIEKYRRMIERHDAEMQRKIEKIRKTLEKMEASGSGSEEEREYLKRYLEDDDDDPTSPQDGEAEGRRAMAEANALRTAFPLAFIAQFDLASLSQIPGFDPALPNDGRLYLFYDLLCLPASYDPVSRTSFRVIHDTSPANTLVRTDLPEELAKIADVDGATLKPATAMPRKAATSMPMESLYAAGPHLRGRQKEKYDAWLMDKVGWPGEPESDRHQLGGWPRAIQQNMQSTAQLAANGVDAGSSAAYRGKKAKALLADAGAWHLIFQLGPDEGIGNLLPGSVNFLLREEDLAARRFDRAWAIYEQS